MLNLWQYGNPVSDNPKQAQLRLRGLLPVLSRLGPCLEFSFSPEVAGLAETPIFFDKSFDRDLPIFEALSALIERLPEATNGCGDSFKPILRQDERSGELRVLARRVKQGCASIMAPNGKK